ncbi:MAG: OmpA family protein [bacterium]
MKNVKALRIVPILLLAGAALGLGGCQVNRSTYDELLNGYNALKVRNLELTDENSGLRASLDDLRRSVSTGSDAAGDAIALNSKLRIENESLLRKLAELDAQLQNLSMQPLTVALDSQTDSALSQLASAYPGLLTYDQARGMLRFTSDVTFASGSYELSEAGRNAVREFGRLLQTTPNAAQYEIIVVGHTDTQPVTMRESRRFRDNAELSAFRALSVRNDLVASGVEPFRVEFAGFGETRPMVPNAANGNTPANRRVEAFLRKNSYTGLTADPVKSKSAAPAAPRSNRSSTPGTTPSPAPAPANNDIEVFK